MIYSFSFESSVSSLYNQQKCFYFVQVPKGLDSSNNIDSRINITSYFCSSYFCSDGLYGLSRPDI